MFRFTEKNKQNKAAAIFCTIIWLISTYFFFGASAIMFSDGFSLDSFSSDFVSMINPVVFIKGVSWHSILVTLFASTILFLVLVVFYLEGRTHKHDYAGKEQGEAQWLVDVESNEKESDEAKKYRETMMDPFKINPSAATVYPNIMFDPTYGLSMNGHKTRKNLNMLIIGGSGAGKTRFFVKPNILQMNSTYIITDPSGELYRDEATMLRENNYDVRVFNTFDPTLSMQYNPLKYIRDDKDVTDLVTTLLANTGGEATGDNQYFDKATTMLLCAIIAFLVNYCPEEDRHFASVMKLVNATNKDDAPMGQSKPNKSPMEVIMDAVASFHEDGIACKQWKSFSSTSGKTLKSVLSSTATRLTAFNYDEIERLTCEDTISLATIGDEKTALFIITPPTDNGFNFLVAMMYSQLFSTLYYRAQFQCRYLLTDNNYIYKPFESKEEAFAAKELIDKQYEINKPNLNGVVINSNDFNPSSLDNSIVHFVRNEATGKNVMLDKDGKKILTELRDETVRRFLVCPNQFSVVQNTSNEAGMPVHVRMLMDEFANINEIPGFSEVISTARKYNISVAIILQSLSQLKKRYEKDYETIIDNCDTFIFLGAKGKDTTEYVSAMLGNMTITTMGEGESLGKNHSSSRNYSQSKRELMTPHELVMLNTNEQVVILKSVYPFRIQKYPLENHPNYKFSADGDKKKLADISELKDWTLKTHKEQQDKENAEHISTLKQWLSVANEKAEGKKTKKRTFDENDAELFS